MRQVFGRAPLLASPNTALARVVQVRNLYKRILTVGKDYPAGLDFVREKAKTEFRKRKDVEGIELKRSVAYGRYMVWEMIGVIQLKKYRSIKRRYREDDEGATTSA